MEVLDTEFCASVPPVHLTNAFDPVDFAGGDPSGWAGLMSSLCPKLPVQMHVEPHAMDSEDAPPVFKRAVKLLRSKPELADIVDVKKARLKFRLAVGGKFVHRNRYQRRNIICCLKGEQWWLFVESMVKNDEGKYIADEYLNATQNDNWNGFRSNMYPATLTLEQMNKIAAEQPPHVRTKVVLFKVIRASNFPLHGLPLLITPRHALPLYDFSLLPALCMPSLFIYRASPLILTTRRLQAGDIMAFDGRWWHATQYDKEVLNCFFTPGMRRCGGGGREGMGV